MMVRFSKDTVEQATVESLCPALLPKLVSGELRVGDVDINKDTGLS